MFYSRICILTDESVTPLQVEESCKVMRRVFGGGIEVDLVLDVFKKKGIVTKKLDDKEMDDILENLEEDARIC